MTAVLKRGMLARRARALAGLAVLFAAMGFGNAARSAAPSGGIHGHVTDLRKVALAAIQVKATNEKTKAWRATATDRHGDYLLPFLPPGSYEVLFITPSIHVVRHHHIVVTEGQTAVLDTEMNPHP